MLVTGCTVCQLTTLRLVEPLQELANRLLEASADLHFQVSALEMIERDGSVTIILRGDTSKGKPVDLVGDVEVKSVVNDSARAEVRSLSYSYIAHIGSNS